MTAPTPNAALAKVRDLLVQFPWSNYGLDETDDAETDWADDLAARLVAEIFGSRPDGAA